VRFSPRTPSNLPDCHGPRARPAEAFSSPPPPARLSARREGRIRRQGHCHRSGRIGRPARVTITLLVDQKELPPGDAPIPNDATRKHYGKGQTEDTVHLEPGDHTLQLDFADALHMQFDPPIVSKKITIHVK
jgi:hypothetical protein